MTNFTWTPIHSNFYQAKVGDFLAEVWRYGDKWKSRFAGQADHHLYETKELAFAACEIHATSLIVCVCNALGYTVRAPNESTP